MMKRTFRRAGGTASKMKNKKDSLKSNVKSVVKGVGKLTPGGAIVGTLKDIRDRKSILNKKTKIKNSRPEAKKPSTSRPRLDKATIEKMNKARDNYYKKNTKRRQYLGNKKG